MRLVVTGNIGCGKSTVCQMLLRQLPDHAFFSVDDAVRSLYADESFCQAVEAAFGTRERKALSDLVFSDPDKRKALEKLSLEFVRPKVDAAFREARVVIEFPLFFELPGNVGREDCVLALGCDDTTQRQRVLARDSISEEKFDRIRASQHSTAMKAALADAFVDTSGTLAEVEAALLSVLPSLKRQALRARCNRFFGSAAVWPIIASAYSEPHRAYHDLTHLGALFEAIEPHLGSTTHAQAIELAIWFHDFVYSTELSRYASNEALSARAMLDVLSRHAPQWLQPDLVREVLLAAEFIVATRKHSLDVPYLKANPQRQEACALFLDADLSILAADAESFARYDQAIAREWGQDFDHPSKAFCEGRAAAMAGFAARERIFFSDTFSNREKAARANLLQLVEAWRARTPAT